MSVGGFLGVIKWVLTPQTQTLKTLPTHTLYCQLFFARLASMKQYSYFLIPVLCLLSIGSVNAGLVDIEQAFMEQDFPRAEALSQEGLKAKSDSNEAEYQFYLGLSQVRLTKYGLATAALKDLVNSSTVSPELRDRAHLALIDAYYLSEQYDKAEHLANQFMVVNGRSNYLSTLYLKLARIKFKQAEWMEARMYLRTIINEYPQSLDVYLANQFLEEKMYFSIQVGSFRDRARAKDLVSQLHAEGRTVYIQEVEDYMGNNFYRVRVGQVSFLDQAKNLEEELKEQGYPTRIYP